MTMRQYVDPLILESAGVPIDRQNALIRQGLFPQLDSKGRWLLDALFEQYYSNRREGDDDAFRDLAWEKLDEPPRPESPADREARIAGLRIALDRAEAAGRKNPSVQNVESYARAKRALEQAKSVP